MSSSEQLCLDPKLHGLKDKTSKFVEMGFVWWNVHWSVES
jgi:hypothetical protein